MKKYYIKTFGCQMNESDSERITSFLEKQGYRSAKNIEGADLIVVNACSVRQTAIDRILGLKPKIYKLKILNPKSKFILTGCILKSDKKKFEKFFDEIVDIKKFLGRDYLSIKPKCPFSTSAFVPIMTGCNNFCSYCVVPYVRGREISRPVKEVINEVKSLIKIGYKEITLLGQNVNSYQYNFAKLLQKINNLPGNFQIKFLTPHPKDMSDELIDIIANCKKVEKEIHLPIQSGDNKILKKMNRHYTVEEYKKLIEKIRKKIPNVEISTDVIVGFPSETKKQFENTVKAFKEIKFDKAYINKYSTRLGTLAAKLKDDVPLKEKKRRWKILNNIVNQHRVEKPKLIVVLGPTASGKSNLAVRLAKRFSARGGPALGWNGFEVVSADSRQVYRGMNIGTGKVPKNSNFWEVEPPYIYKGIPHYCLDLVSPKKQFTVAQYKEKALEVIDKIYKKGKIPILCGGTGFYIQAVTGGLIIPVVKPDWKLRKELEKETTEELFKKLKKLDPNRAKNIDSKNRRRLIRALEIILKTGKPVPKIKSEPRFDILYIGIKKPDKELKKAINKRIDKMIKNGLEKEVKKLVKKYGWTIVIKNAISYQEFKDYLNKETSLREVIEKIKTNTYQFAKRQITWFRKYPGNKKIHWIKPYTKIGFNKVIEPCKTFLRK